MAAAAKRRFKWDVFASHNGAQKSWVREVVRQWRNELGLRVFFDEDSIMGGHSIDDAIETGLKASRHVVLFLSPEAVESRWVTLEQSIAIYADPDAQRRFIVPVEIKRTDKDKIKASIVRLNIISLIDPTNQ
jgi:hypothetical protein